MLVKNASWDSSLFDRLTLPAFDSLEVSVVLASGIRRLESFVARSGCSVRALQLDNTALAETRTCVSLLHSLMSTEFTIRMPRLSARDFTRFFQWLIDSRDLLPVLDSGGVEYFSVPG
ncbi:hypothetical protein FB451DRAFT_1411351 [Mycena latifolia]|nr:hypothetical protein FB451DRAFT_1411351 [Mycena latifolia]